MIGLFVHHLHQGLPIGRSMCNGGGGGSSSSSNTSTTTQTTDKRMVVDQGIGISSDSSTVTVNSLDRDIVNKALETVQGADAVAGDGFNKLLGLTEKLFQAGEQVLNSNTKNAQTTIGALTTAANDATGKIDQKTILILAGAGVAAAFALKGKK